MYKCSQSTPFGTCRGDLQRQQTHESKILQLIQRNLEHLINSEKPLCNLSLAPKTIFWSFDRCSYSLLASVAGAIPQGLSPNISAYPPCFNHECYSALCDPFIPLPTQPSQRPCLSESCNSQNPLRPPSPIEHSQYVTAPTPQYAARSEDPHYQFLNRRA